MDNTELVAYIKDEANPKPWRMHGASILIARVGVVRAMELYHTAP